MPNSTHLQHPRLLCSIFAYFTSPSTSSHCPHLAPPPISPCHPTSPHPIPPHPTSPTPSHLTSSQTPNPTPSHLIQPHLTSPPPSLIPLTLPHPTLLTPSPHPPHPTSCRLTHFIPSSLTSLHLLATSRPPRISVGGDTLCTSNYHASRHYYHETTPSSQLQCNFNLECKSMDKTYNK